MFQPFARDLAATERDEKRLTALLEANSPLTEKDDLLPFFRSARHLCAWLGRANPAFGDADLLAIEKPVLGSFRCDIAIGDTQTGQFTLVELEDAAPNNVFEPVKGRDHPRWSRRFERGFSQLVDWAWRIDHERAPSATLAAAFGTPSPKLHYLLVVGRNQWIGDAGRVRLDWRRLHNGISGERVTIWTYDDLLAFVRVRLRTAERDTAMSVRGLRGEAATSN